MRRIFYIPLVLVVLSACQSIPATATEAPQVTASLMPDTATAPAPATEAPAAIATATEKPKESWETGPFIQNMDQIQVMDSPFDADGNLRLDEMVAITEGDFKENAQNTMQAIWHTEGIYYDKDGNVILPPGVIPMKQEDLKHLFRISSSKNPVFNQQVNYFGPGGATHPDISYDATTSPIQWTDRYLKFIDNEGKIVSVMSVDRLYYDTADGKHHLGAMFAQVDIDKILEFQNEQGVSSVVTFILRALKFQGQDVPAFTLGVKEGGHMSFNSRVNNARYLSSTFQKIRNDITAELEKDQPGLEKLVEMLSSVPLAADIFTAK